jgi:hypothetical protein
MAIVFEAMPFGPAGRKGQNLELRSLADRPFLFRLPQSLTKWLHRALADVNNHAIRSDYDRGGVDPGPIGIGRSLDFIPIFPRPDPFLHENCCCADICEADQRSGRKSLYREIAERGRCANYA